MHLPASFQRQHSREARATLRAADTLFPLRLTPFEEYMYLDHLSGNSMVFCVRVTVEGFIERKIIEQALEQTAADNPLLRATIDRRWWGRYEWSLEQDVRPYCEWHDGSNYTYRVPQLDLTIEAGLRVVVVQHDDTTQINVFMHHTVGDGVAAFSVVEQLLTNYALATGADPQSIRKPKLDPQLLADRERLRWRSYRGWEWVKGTLSEYWKFFTQVPTALRSRFQTPLPAAEQFPEFLDATLTYEETRAIRLAAHAEDLTVNELLISELFRSLAEWNDRFRAPDSTSLHDPWYRVAMPTNLRDHADERTSVANIVSMAFLNRRRSVIAGDEVVFRQTIKTESNEIRTRHRGEFLLEAFAVMRAIPGLIPGLMWIPFTMSSAVLTNLGDPCRRFRTKFRWDARGMLVGNLRVLSMSGIPPYRKRTNVVMGSIIFGHRLRFSVQMDPELFRRQDCEAFVALYTERLRRHCASAS